VRAWSPFAWICFALFMGAIGVMLWDGLHGRLVLP